MSEREDKYKTRVDSVPQITSREDPIFHDETMANSGPLSTEQTDAYERDGFLFLDSLYGEEELAALQAEAEHLRGLEEIRQSELSVTEPTSGETRSVFAVHTVSGLFDLLTRDSRILDIVRQILGSDVYLHQTRLNLKPGFRGKEFYWHSDFETWHAEDGMPKMRAVSCSITLTDNNEFNGPVMFIPGSHKYFCQCAGLTPENHYQQSLKRQDYGVPSDEQLEWLIDQGGLVAPTGPVGSVQIFDCNIMHGSNSNITPFARRNAFLVYNSIENALVKPFAADYERPWYLGNRKPEAVQPVDFHKARQHDVPNPRESGAVTAAR